MRLAQFNVGDKVYVPNAGDPEDGSRYSTILTIGNKWVFLLTEGGDEFLAKSDRDDFVLWKPRRDIDVMRELGDDLVAAIEDAEFTDGDRPHLWGPTMHMLSAVENWRNRNV